MPTIIPFPKRDVGFIVPQKRTDLIGYEEEEHEESEGDGIVLPDEMHEGQIVVPGYRPFGLIDLFPVCLLPDCPEKDNKNHKHILPHQQKILDCTSKYLYCQGGVGSAKSLAFAVKCVWLSLTIDENRGVVSRLHYDDLFDSSWREIKECLKRLVEGKHIPEPKYSKKVQGDYTQIVLHNGSEIKAVQGKNWSRGLGASHGWFWIDDALESQKEFFTGTQTSAGLISRLRLPHVLHDKRTYHPEHREHGSLHGMVSSNPPAYGHWLHELFGAKEGTYHIGNNLVTWMRTETGDNPFVGENYAKDLIAVQQKLGDPEDNIRRMILGESVSAHGGYPVFPQFKPEVHVAPLKFRPDLPLIRAWDFGHTHPSVIFANIYRCSHGTNHYFTLSEIADVYNVTVYQLYDKHVLPHTKDLYSKACLIRDCGDRSGYRTSTSNKDGRSDMKILMFEYHLNFRWKYMDLKASLQYMRGLLTSKLCKCGLPLALISNRCPNLIEALKGGYKYNKTKYGVVTDKPVEDRRFADVACAWRYGAENYVKWGVAWEDQKEMRNVNRSTIEQPPLTPFHHDINIQKWLERVDHHSDQAETIRMYNFEEDNTRKQRV